MQEVSAASPRLVVATLSGVIFPRLAACGSCTCCTSSDAHTTTIRGPRALQASSLHETSLLTPRSASPAEINVTSRRPHRRTSNPHLPHHLRPRGPPRVPGSRRQPLPVLIVASPRPSRSTRASCLLPTLTPRRTLNYRTAGVALRGHSPGGRSPRRLCFPPSILTVLLQLPHTLLTSPGHLVAAISSPEHRFVPLLVVQLGPALSATLVRTSFSGCKHKASPSGCFSPALTAATNF